MPLARAELGTLRLFVRTEGAPGPTVADVRSAIHGVDASLPVYDARTYGVMAYAVSQRTQELGIRLALGASPGSLLNMIVGQGMKLTITGLGIGLVLALAAFGSIGAVRLLLPGISPLDPITFVSVPVVLGLIALLASWIPGRRAGKVDPLVALRYE